MKPKLLLTLAAIYGGLGGIGQLLIPTQNYYLDANISTLSINLLRSTTSLLIGLAVVYWLARNAEASKALNAIILGNTAGFSLSVILGFSVALTGSEVVSWVFTGLSLFCLVGFIVVGRANMSAA